MKTITIIASILLVLFIAGCGGSNNGAVPDRTGTEENSEKHTVSPSITGVRILSATMLETGKLSVELQIERTVQHDLYPVICWRGKGFPISNDGRSRELTLPDFGKVTLGQHSLWGGAFESRVSEEGKRQIITKRYPIFYFPFNVVRDTQSGGVLEIVPDKALEKGAASGEGTTDIVVKGTAHTRYADKALHPDYIFLIPWPEEGTKGPLLEEYAVDWVPITR